MACSPVSHPCMHIHERTIPSLTRFVACVGPNRSPTRAVIAGRQHGSQEDKVHVRPAGQRTRGSGGLEPAPYFSPLGPEQQRHDQQGALGRGAVAAGSFGHPYGAGGDHEPLLHTRCVWALLIAHAQVHYDHGPHSTP
ncbi:unnamed protein product [Ectocarpus sp. 4 AP-2014]